MLCALSQLKNWNFEQTTLVEWRYINMLIKTRQEKQQKSTIITENVTSMSDEDIQCTCDDMIITN